MNFVKLDFLSIKNNFVEFYPEPFDFEYLRNHIYSKFTANHPSFPEPRRHGAHNGAQGAHHDRHHTKKTVVLAGPARRLQPSTLGIEN